MVNDVDIFWCRTSSIHRCIHRFFGDISTLIQPVGIFWGVSKFRDKKNTWFLEKARGLVDLYLFFWYYPYAKVSWWHLRRQRFAASPRLTAGPVRQTSSGRGAKLPPQGGAFLVLFLVQRHAKSTWNGSLSSYIWYILLVKCPSCFTSWFLFLFVFLKPAAF